MKTVAEYAEKRVRELARTLRRRRGVSVQPISCARLEEIGTPVHLHIGANIPGAPVFKSAWRAYRRAVRELGPERVTFSLPGGPARYKVRGRWRVSQ